MKTSQAEDQEPVTERGGAAAPLPRRTLQVAGATHVGLYRKRNEDALLLLPEHRVVAVADGMGGRLYGDVASDLAVGVTRETFRRAPSAPDDLEYELGFDARSTEEEELERAFHAANESILRRGLELTGLEGTMGTTLVAAAFSPDLDRVAITHVGDSRCYRYRGGALTLLTRDHSFVNAIADRAPWLPPNASPSVSRSVLTRALGLRASMPVDTRVDEPRPDDVYLLCSDGLWSVVDHADIESALERHPTLEEACDVLVDRANARGGPDNITIVLARVAHVSPPRRSGLAPRSTHGGRDDVEGVASAADLSWDACR